MTFNRLPLPVFTAVPFFRRIWALVSCALKASPVTAVREPPLTEMMLEAVSERSRDELRGICGQVRL
jgi:hypothetical protein